MTKITQFISGLGFSSDTQQITNAQCYNVINSTNSPTTTIKLQEAMSFHDLENTFGISVDVGLNFGVFSGGSTTSYLRQMQEKDYSLSLNYYEVASAEIKLEAAGYGTNGFLNDIGKAIYNNGTNKYFGLVCGDQYVTSYQVGAVLALGININLESNYQKKQFISASGGSFGDIFSASTSIENIVQSLSLNGEITLNAFQIGGEPQYLSSILKTNSTGDYYSTSCNLQNMNDCVQAANGLLTYATKNFTNQFSFNPANNLFQIQYLFQYQPIEYLGVTPPPSLITPEVTSARKNLANALFENQYYQQKITELYASYPEINTSSGSKTQFSDNFNTQIQNLLNVVQSNLNLLTNSDDPEMNPINCYNQPQACPEIANNILSNLQPITAGNLTFFNVVSHYYTSPIDNCQCGTPGAQVSFYYTGSEWGYLNDPGLCDQVYDLETLTIAGNNSILVFDTKSVQNGLAWHWQLSEAELHANGDIQFNQVNAPGAGAACTPTWLYSHEFQVQIEPYQPDLI